MGLEDLIDDGCLGIVFWIGGLRWTWKACAIGPDYMKEEKGGGGLVQYGESMYAKADHSHLGDEKMDLKGCIYAQ